MSTRHFMNDLDLIQEAYNVADEIKKTKEYLDVSISLNQLKQDPENVILMERFHQAKLKYDEALPLKEYHRDFKKIASAFIEAKTSLYSHPNYQDYLNKLQSMNRLLNDFSKQLNSILSACYINPGQTCKKV